MIVREGCGSTEPGVCSFVLGTYPQNVGAVSYFLGNRRVGKLQTEIIIGGTVTCNLLAKREGRWGPLTLKRLIFTCVYTACTAGSYW